MRILRYMGKCFFAAWEIFSPPATSPTTEIALGLFEILICLAIFIMLRFFVPWYYAILITIGVVIILCIVVFLIECVICLILKLKK